MGEALSALPRPPAFLLLVGDDLEKGGDEPWRVPARRRTLYRLRSAQPEEFASDSVYGDTDGDLVPDFPVGRIPARTPEEMARAVRFGRKESEAAFASGPPVSPLVLLTCDSGRFTGEIPCLAERLLLLPGGPVAVIAATTESHPLPNFFTGQCLLDALQGGKPRLGEVWLRTQREGRNARSFLIERMLRDAEGSLEPEIDVAKLRRDQPLLYAILGDPATRLKLPDPLEAEVTKIADGWRFRATRPEGATHLEVGHRRFRPAHSRAGKRPASPEAARAAFEGENEAGAFRILSRLDAGGEWTGAVTEPGTLRLVATGPGTIRVFTADLGR